MENMIMYKQELVIAKVKKLKSLKSRLIGNDHNLYDVNVLLNILIVDLELILKYKKFGYYEGGYLTKKLANIDNYMDDINARYLTRK